MTTPIVTELAGLYVLPLPTPFPVGRINAYLALDDAPTLIDTGVNSELSYTALVDGLAALDMSLADIRRVIITHHHTDHVGQVDRVVDASEAAVWCHSRCVPYIEQPDETREHLREWMVGIWREGGAPQAVLDLTAQLFSWFATLGNRPTPVSHQLEDGDSFTMLGKAWSVLHLPGHAGDLIGLFEPTDRILLASDHLLRDVSSNALAEPPEPGQSRPRRLLEYMSQLQRVADLHPRIAYSGHGEPVVDVPALVGQRLAFHRERADRILSLLAAQPHTLWQLTAKMFPHVPEPEQFLALSEVLGHVDWLENDGCIQSVRCDDGIQWRIV